MARTCLLAGLATLLWAWTSLAAARPPALFADASTSIESLAPYVQWYHDPDPKSDLDSAIRALEDGRFEPLGNAPSNFGFLAGSMWLQFDVDQGPVAAEWLLVLEYPLVDDVTLYRLDPDGQLRQWPGGDTVNFNERGADLRYVNWRQHLDAGQRVRYFLRANSQSSMQLPLVWAQPDHYVLQKQRTVLGLGMYFGILIALSAYNLILFLSTRDRNFLYYVIYVLSFGWMLACLSGLAFQYLWPGLPQWANTSVLLSMAASLISMLQFSRRFLDLNTQFPLGNLLCLILMTTAAALGLAALFLPYGWVVRVLTVQVFPAAILIYACGVFCLRTVPAARYFLLAWTLLLLGIMIYASVSLGWLPKSPITEYSIQIGSAAEMILLSFALAYRLNVLRAANARSQSEAREELEQRVRERTADLDSALKRLEQANHRLQDFSRRDGLTGVFNRRSFDHILQRAEMRRLEQGETFALLMLDCDHFKDINDRHGHLVGDDCLRHLARTVAPLVEAAGGQLARYGGEEFAAVIAGLDLQQAAALARGIRAAVAEQPLNANGLTIPMTVSIGVALRGRNAEGPAIEVVKQADAAMYQAKQAGRDRVAIGG